MVEINEPFHKNNVEVDKIRNEEIVNKTHSELRIIDCGYVTKGEGDKDVIHWKPPVEYHRQKGYLKVEDNECLRTADDVAAVFGTKPKHRGFLRASGAAVPGKKNEIIWWPNTAHKRWHNELSKDGMFIYEYPEEENKSVTRSEHLKQWLSAPEETRITFLRYEDDLGFCFYRFVGVFRLDKEKSVRENKCVWERISDFYQLNV